MWLLLASGVAAAASALSAIWLAGLVSNIQSGVRVGSKTISNYETFEMATVWCQLLLMLPTAIAFTKWMSFGYSQLPLLSNTPPQYTKSQVRWSFYIPFICLARPYYAVLEMWNLSVGPSRPTAVKLWWATWLAFGLLNNIASRTMGDGEDLNRLLASAWMTLVANAAGAISAAVAMHVVGEITKAQSQRLHQEVQVAA